MKSSIVLSVITALLAFPTGYYAGQTNKQCPICQSPPPCPNPPPCPKCEFNITGTLHKSGGDLFNQPKTQITIFFNGIDVMNGYLSNNNEANLVGTYHNKETTAQCSGTENIKCLISYNGEKTPITFSENK